MGQRGPKPGGSLSVIDPRPPERPKPPTGMTKRARARWKEIVASLPATHFKEGDWPLLRSYCEAEALNHKAVLEMEEHGTVVMVQTKFGMVQQDSRWFKVFRETAATMASLATKLRLCANSRIDNWKAAKDAGGETKKSRRSGLMYGG